MKLIAYLDPGTGSLIIQTVLGGAAGVTLLVKTRGRRLLKKQQTENPAEAAAASAPDPVTPAAPVD
jgi:hypothetical protein